MQFNRFNGRLVVPPEPPFKTRPALVRVHLALTLFRWGIQ